MLLLTDAGMPGPSPQNDQIGFGKQLSGILRQPITLLIVSSVLIPFIVFSFNSCKARRDARQTKALDVIEKNSAFDGTLYSLYADLTTFYVNTKAIQGETPEERQNAIKSAQEKFLGEFSTRNVEFAKTYSDQHLWVDDLLLQGEILELYSADDLQRLRSYLRTQKVGAEKSLTPQMCNCGEALAKLSRDVYAYRLNVSRSVGIIGKYLKLVSAPGYEPNPAEEEVKKKLDAELTAITSSYNDQHAERKQIIDELVKDFDK
ncbi:MAG TPA: hypothetical protein DC054_06205 [Blastocatellia bacterium]|nr:hypothetical protein [Blastocatellia bacterium]